MSDTNSYKTIVVPTFEVHVAIGAALVDRRDQLLAYVKGCDGNGVDKAYWMECLELAEAAVKAWMAAK